MSRTYRTDGICPHCGLAPKAREYGGYCKECWNKYRRERYQNNPEVRERVKKRHREWCKNNREHHLDCTRKWRRKHRKHLSMLGRKYRYGVTQEQFDAKLREQGWKCAVCKKRLPRSKDQHCDHDHKTGKIRGILCSRCNHGLGMFQDDIRILRKAINYLVFNASFSDMPAVTPTKPL